MLKPWNTKANGEYQRLHIPIRTKSMMSMSYQLWHDIGKILIRIIARFGITWHHFMKYHSTLVFIKNVTKVHKVIHVSFKIFTLLPSFIEKEFSMLHVFLFPLLLLELFSFFHNKICCVPTFPKYQSRCQIFVNSFCLSL